MKIAVIYADGSLGIVGAEELDTMLEGELVLAFRRSAGWAVAGRDALRSSRSNGMGSWRDRKSGRQLLNMRRTGSSGEGDVLFQWEAIQSAT